jgi:hypothetical protein
MTKTRVPDSASVQLDGVGEISQDHVQGLGVPVVQQHAHRFPRPRSTPGH